MNRFSNPIVALALLMAACGTSSGNTGGSSGGGSSATDVTQLASDGNEATAASAQSTDLGNLVTAAVTSQDPDKATSDFAMPTKLSPSGCVSKAKDAASPRVVNVTFKECTGPFGLLHLNGEMIVTFSAGTGGALAAAINGKGLSANGHPVTYAAQALITLSGTSSQVKWHGSWTLTTAGGKAVSHTSDLQLGVDTAMNCTSASGTEVTLVDMREVDTAVKAYQVCRASDGMIGCPTGSVTHTSKESGKSVAITFDGSNTAKVTGPAGVLKDVPLVCGAGTSGTGSTGTGG